MDSLKLENQKILAKTMFSVIPSSKKILAKTMFSVILLNGCPYCIAVEKLLNTFNKSIKIKYIRINSSDMEKYKTKKITTFPQVYFIDENDKSYLIGGYDTTKDLVDKIRTININEISRESLKDILPYCPYKIKLKIIIILKSLV